MTDFDASLAAVLDEVLPPSGESGDWQRVLRDAQQAPGLLRLLGARRRTRRFVVVLALVVLVVLIPLVAVAADQGWWFFSTPVQAPAAGGVVVVERGTWQGKRWALVAYRTERRGLCVGFTANPPTGAPPTPAGTNEPVGSLGCGAPVHSMPGRPASKSLNELAFWATESDNVTVVAGPTAGDVTRVQFVPAHGPTRSVPTAAAPSALHVPVRFFVTFLRASSTAEVIKAIGRDGHVVQTATLAPTQTQTTPGSTAPGSTRTYKLQAGP